MIISTTAPNVICLHIYGSFFSTALQLRRNRHTALCPRNDCILHGWKKGLHALQDELDLSIVIVAIASGAAVAGGCDALAGGLVGQIAVDLLDEFVKACKEDGLFVLLEALPVSVGALGKQEATAAGDLEALMDELVLI